MTRRSLRALITLDAVPAADLLTVPTLVVHGRVDAYCTPEAAQSTFDRVAAEHKELLWLDTSNHIELYDDPRFVVPAVDAVAAWFSEHLA